MIPKLAYLLVALMAIAAGYKLQQHVQTNPTAISSNELLAFGFPDINGQMQSVQQWQGKILLINFWATWCAPCLKEIPEFIHWQQEYRDRNVQFVGIAIDDRQAVAGYMRGAPINYPILIAGDAGSLLSRQLGNIINAVPFTVIINPQGQILHRQPGELSKQQFLTIVRPLLDVKQPE